MFTPVKLSKTRTNLRMAIFGPTGSGKTFTSILLARNICDGQILVIDTEHSTAGMYAEQLNSDGRIDVIELPDFSPLTYKSAVEWASSQGYQAIVIDSLSHAWTGKDGALEQVDKVSKRSTSGNSFAAWKEVTPMHNALVECLLTSPCHVIVTMRVKTDYVMEEDRNGKKTPKKVGLAPIQKDGMEYEFDLCAEMDQENNLIVTKSRAFSLQGYVEKKPGSSFGDKVRAWLEAGVAPSIESSPERALTTYGLDNLQLSAFKERCKASGHKFSEVVLAAYNSGVRGSVALNTYIVGLAPKAEANGEPKTAQPVATAESTTPTEPAEKPVDKTPEAKPRLELLRSEVEQASKILAKGGLNYSATLAQAKALGITTSEEFMKHCEAQAAAIQNKGAKTA